MARNELIDFESSDGRIYAGVYVSKSHLADTVEILVTDPRSPDVGRTITIASSQLC